jgi:hypothetical protein
MHKEFFFVNYNTLLHVSTLLGHLQRENIRLWRRLHASISGAVHNQQHILA